MREYRRLLYVALTRARDRLYICGYETKLGREDGCWYDLVSNAMTRLNANEITDADGASIKRFGDVPTKTAARGEVVSARAPIVLPPWVQASAVEEPVLRHVTPSVAVGRSGARTTPSDMAVTSHAMERGRVIHRLLEHLASAPAASWSSLAFQMASAALPDPALAQSAAAEALRARRDLLVAHIFGPGSYGEVPLRGLIQWQGEAVDMAARLDRILIGEREVTIVEFKTDRVVPKRDSAIPRPYVTQLALYRVAVARMFEGQTVNCGILWTAEPRFTLIAAKHLEDAAASA